MWPFLPSFLWICDEISPLRSFRYFSMTKDILRKHSHVSSFGAIQRDCENTVKRLQEKLQEEVNSSVSCYQAALTLSPQLCVL